MKVNAIWKVIGIVIVSVIAFSIFAGQPSQQQAVVQQQVIAPPVTTSYQGAQQVQTVLPDVQPQTQQPSSGLSNDNYYVNVSGNTVHSPAYTNDNSVPAGASAQCRDGTYSFSQHRSGTCSHHGGVSRWLQ